MILPTLQRVLHAFIRLMGGEPKILKRMLILVKPKQAYVQWVRQRSDNPSYTLAESRQEDSIAFLIPTENWDRAEADAFIAHFWVYFFRQMLSAWEHNEATWPQDPTLIMFHHWFDVEVCDMVHDLGRWKG
jgi:hypothetical protein